MAVTIQKPPFRTPIQGPDGRISQEWLIFFEQTIDDINANDTELATKITKLTGGTAGNIPRIAAGGGLEDSDVPGNFAAAGFDLAEAVAAAANVTALQATTGGNAINLGSFNTALTTLTTEINAINAKVTELITSLQTAGIMEE